MNEGEAASWNPKAKGRKAEPSPTEILLHGSVETPSSIHLVQGSAPLSGVFASGKDEGWEPD